MMMVMNVLSTVSDERWASLALAAWQSLVLVTAARVRFFMVISVEDEWTSRSSEWCVGAAQAVPVPEGCGVDEVDESWWSEPRCTATARANRSVTFIAASRMPPVVASMLSLSGGKILSSSALARNLVDLWLLRYGVERVLYLDADTFFNIDPSPFYFADVVRGRWLFAFEKLKCRWSEGYHGDVPDDILDKRFKTDAFVVADLGAYCRANVVDKVMDLLRLKNRPWRKGTQQAPFVIALAPFIQLFNMSTGTPIEKPLCYDTNNLPPPTNVILDQRNASCKPSYLFDSDSNASFAFQHLPPLRPQSCFSSGLRLYDQQHKGDPPRRSKHHNHHHASPSSPPRTLM